MADVTPDGRSARDRGQMLLIAAFGVAVMLVALALILNTAIYTENIATRGSDISGGKDAARYRAATQDSIGGTIEYANYHNNSSYTELETAVRWGVWNYSNMSGRQQAMDSIVTNVSLERHSEGTRVYQHADGEFDNDTGTANWTVVESTDGVRNFTVNATSNLGSKDPEDVSPQHNSQIFFANFTDPDEDEWYGIKIFEDADTGVANVTVLNDDGYQQGCEASYESGRVSIDVTGATLNGERCAPLETLQRVSSDPFDLKFNNSDKIKGQYSLVANTTYFDASLDDAPQKTRASYSTSVHLVYESDRLYYETDIRVAPGEFDD